MAHFTAHPETATAIVVSAWSHVAGVWYAYAIIAACVYYLLKSKPSVYMMDFAMFEAPKSWQINRAEIHQILSRHGQKVGAEEGTGDFTAASISFMTKLLNNSGTGEATSWPPGTTRLLQHGQVDPTTGEVIEKADTSLVAARRIAHTVLVGALRTLLARNPGIKAKDIDFLVVNCSLFCPTPSLASNISRHFGMKPTLRSYNLGGMGCSASLISIDLAKQLLQCRPGSLAIVLSTEEISQSLYTGNDRSMLVQNTLFRVGGAAILLSNKPLDGFRARYKLLHTVRVQDMTEAGACAVKQQEDAEGMKGIFLSKEIVTVAGKALKDNLTILGTTVLPIREQLGVVGSIAWWRATKVLNATADAWRVAHIPFTKTGRFEKVAVYVPDFKKAIRHFCIHAGGRAVIDGIEKSLGLDRVHTAPSRATLFHWGNTSSSSIWYELRYCEGEKEYWRGAPAAARETVSMVDAAPSVVPSVEQAAGEGAAKSGTGVRQRSGAGAAPAAPLDATTVTSEAVPDGWDPSRKWHLPDYEGRHVVPGDRVLQVAFGSGFKCNSAVWLCMRR
jgi:predicted naringenin-chalcone synthase